MTTEIGKELRKLRIDEDERLLDMSQRLERSSAFISAVERGTKSPPSGFEEIVIKAYRLAGEAADVMRRAADRSRKAFTIEADSPLARDTAGLMARRMDSLSDDELKSIFQILNKKDAK
ncbi:transcriptional regulator [Limimaricola cinnabarinus]|uniref:Transcriptional regulator n=1 Tax=Limimaricola cinnabarinus TaxID=1125964 RepID=A0A2G1MDN6_9RHOB|nr:transcriptional regulator [Limimaricola cinnabarinus]PHP26831.1 transcriptional regulator [Limimaricola cinnabarinus]